MHAEQLALCACHLCPETHGQQISPPSARRVGRAPGTRLAQRLAPHHGHDVHLHLGDVLLQVLVLLGVLALAVPVVHHPRADDEGCDGNRKDEVHPKPGRDAGIRSCVTVSPGDLGFLRRGSTRH